MDNEKIKKSIDELCDLVDTLNYQVTALRLEIYGQRYKDLLPNLANKDTDMDSLETMVCKTIDDLRKSMPDDEIKDQFFNEKTYKQMLIDFDNAIKKEVAE